MLHLRSWLGVTLSDKIYLFSSSFHRHATRSVRNAFSVHDLIWSLHQGCGVGVGVQESESEGFSTWGVGFVENFNDSDSGQTFCSPIVTFCATNVRRRHTWQFKQLDASTRDDYGIPPDRRQRTNFHTFTQGPFQISSVPWAHHATYTLWIQPFGACITEISICSFWLALSFLRDVGYATMNESSHGCSSIVT